MLINIKKNKGALNHLIVAIIMMVVSGLFLKYFAWPSYQEAKASIYWPSTKGKITSSSVKQARGSKGDRTYKPNIIYSYKTNGKNYTSNQTYAGSSHVSSSNRLGSQKTVNKYPVGKIVTVFYSPENPEIAVLEPGLAMSHRLIVGAVGLMFLVGLYLLLSSVFKMLVLGTLVGLGLKSIFGNKKKTVKRSQRSSSSGFNNNHSEINLDDELKQTNKVTYSSKPQ